MLDESAARGFVWIVLLGLVMGGALVTYGCAGIFRALPADVRARAADAVQRHARLTAIASGTAAWTLVFALYSLAFPGAAVTHWANAANPTASPTATVGPPSTNPTVGPSSDGRGQATAPAAAPPLEPPESAAPPPNPAPESSTEPDPTPDGPSEPEPCSAAAVAETLRDAQIAVEQLTGRPLDADMADLIEAAAGCKDPTAAALSLLAPVDALLDEAGIPNRPLPAIPARDLPRPPEPVADPVRVAALDACAQILSQGYTIAVLAPVLRIDFDDAVSVVDLVSDVCRTFAAEAPS